MIPNDIVDKIYSSAKIEEVVGDYVSLKRRGASYWGLCPFPGHTEKTPSFSVTPARGICKCFGCGRGGNAVKFVMEMEQCSYPEALRKVAKKYNIEIPEREMTAEEKQHHDDRESMFHVNEWANSWFQKQLWETPEGQAVALAYLHERGLRDETIRRFQLGYSPDGKDSPMLKAARAAGYKDIYLDNDNDTHIGTGLCCHSGGEDGKPRRMYDRFSGRVIFPFLSVSGKVVGFAGRVMTKEFKGGKYVNSPESIIYTKGNEMFGFSLAKQAIHKEQRCYLVEGQMDVISMSQAGITNVVCSGGTGLTSGHVRMLHRFTDDVTILYDGDDAGIKATLKAINMFLSENMNVKVMLFPDGEDPDSYARTHTSEEFVQYVSEHEENFLTYMVRVKLQGVTDFQRRREAILAINNTISLIYDRILRDMYIKECARLTETPEQNIRREVIDLQKKHRQEKEAEREAKEAGANSTGEQEPPIIGVDDQPQAQPVQPQVPQILSAIDINYHNLIRLLIRFGEQQIHFADGDQTNSIRVGDYIQQYLGATQLSYGKPLFQRFFEEFNAHKDDPEFSAERFFVNHADPEISDLAADLLSEKYTLCKHFEEMEAELTNHQLIHNVLHILYELHFSTVEQSIKQCDDTIKQATQDNNDLLVLQAMQTMQQLIKLRNDIAALLGQR